MSKPKIITRKTITYVLYEDKIVVGIGANQWVSYNPYDNWNRQGLTQFKETILKSKDDQYSTPSEQMTLASRCGIIGTSADKPKELV